MDSGATPPADRRVIIVMIDGPRYTEAFGDSLHAHVPGMWNTLRPQGTLCSNFRNLGRTITNPGHGTVLTGIRQNIDNQGEIRVPDPTLFEYYRKARSAPATDAMLFGGKLKLDALAYSTNSDYGPAYGATVDVDSNTDLETYDDLIHQLDHASPHLVLCSFSDTDQAGHSGVWSDYLRALEIADSLVTLTWNHLQADPDYAGRTYMFITADHGRHDAAHGGFKDHGDDCEGCRHIIFLALGPGIRAGAEVTRVYGQEDICATVGKVMGFPTPHSSGGVMKELFEPAPAAAP
jgi:hypothetical protein